MKIRNFGKTAIHVTFGDKKIKLYVSKYSTCEDVLQSTLVKLSNTDVKTNTLAVFEQSGGTDRMLSGSARVLKIIRSWGCEGSKFELVVKRKSTVLDLKKEFLTTDSDAESFIDDVYSKHFNRKESVSNYLELPAFNKRISSSSIRRPHSKYLSSDETSQPLNVGSRNQTTSLDKKVGKQALLSRYISDVFLHNTNRRKSLSKRGNGDGTENPDTSRDLDGSSDSVLMAACRKSWELDIDTDNETDNESVDEASYFTDSELSFDGDVRIDELDMAFVKSIADSDSDEGIDVTSVNSGDLNTAFVGDFDILSDPQDDLSESVHESSFDESSLYKSDERMYHVRPTVDFMKKLFEKSREQSEDDEMDSFMVSRLEVL